MIHIDRIGSRDVISKLPDMQEVGEREPVLEDGDVLICAAGFEDRTTAIASQEISPNCKTLLIEYSTNTNDNADNLKSLQSLTPSGPSEHVIYDRFEFRRKLTSSVRNLAEGSPKTVVVDISGMASFVLSRVLDAVMQSFPDSSLQIFYAEAKEYYPSKKEWEKFLSKLKNASDLLEMAEQYEENKFQSQGMEVAYESETFPGKNIGPVATQVVVIPNFSLERTKSLLSFAESQYNTDRDKVIWLLGNPPNQEKNGWRLDALAKLYQLGSRGVPVDTLDYRGVIRVLEDQWDELHVENHIVVASLGSKMQHVGTFLFLCMHREVGLVLGEPTHYVANRYSRGIGTSWRLDFGPIADLKNLLAKRGTLEFEWRV